MVLALLLWQLAIGVLIWICYAGFRIDDYNDDDFLLYLLASRVLLAAFCTFITAVQLAALLHRMIWPFVARAIYATQRFQIIGHRKITGSIGFALVGLGLGEPKWLAFVGHLVRAG